MIKQDLIRRKDAVDCMFDELVREGALVSGVSVDELKASPEYKEIVKENFPAYEKIFEKVPAVEPVPELQEIGVVKEYDNGMVAMRKETYQEYENIAEFNAIRQGDFVNHDSDK